MASFFIELRYTHHANLYILSSIIMATSKITVELLQDIAHLGRKGQIIDVSTPQARNSLIPQGIVKEITAERMKKIETDKKRTSDQARIRLTQAFDTEGKKRKDIRWTG
jgi:ribosomal protein L9